MLLFMSILINSEILVTWMQVTFVLYFSASRTSGSCFIVWVKSRVDLEVNVSSITFLIYLDVAIVRYFSSVLQ